MHDASASIHDALRQFIHTDKFQFIEQLKLRCHCEPVTDVTGVAISKTEASTLDQLVGACRKQLDKLEFELLFERVSISSVIARRAYARRGKLSTKTR